MGGTFILKVFIGDFGVLSGLFGRDFLRKKRKKEEGMESDQIPQKSLQIFLRNFRFGIYFGIR